MSISTYINASTVSFWQIYCKNVKKVKCFYLPPPTTWAPPPSGFLIHMGMCKHYTTYVFRKESGMDTKICSMCNKSLPKERFRYRKGKGYDSRCVDCKLAQLRSLPRGKESRESLLCRDYRKSDKRKGLECNITAKWLRSNITSKPCYYCGSTEHIGADRIDNSRGHTKDNVIPACFRCNSIRNSFFTVEQMRELAQFVVRKGW